MNKIEKEPSHTYTSVAESVFQVERSAWNNCANFIDDNRNIGNPFLSHEFFSCLEESGSVSKETGWISQHILLFEEGNSLIGILPNYLKNHSWGEYIFDQVFANAWENAGGKYYPKLLSAIPFSPVAGERFLIKKGYSRKFVIEKLLDALEDLKKFYKVSSAHINFINEPQLKIALKNKFWFERNNIQFHWRNQNYENFEHFLSKLSSSKRKTIRRERKEIHKSSVLIDIVKNDEIKNYHSKIFYNFYLSTIEKKWGGVYLNQKFWDLLIQYLKKRIVFIFSKQDGEFIGGAINLIDQNTIYGRNWGSIKDIKFMHFEVCYYQAIEYAIMNNLKKVEAGAQGFHKIQRGYLPTKTYSIHNFSNKNLSLAVQKFLNSERTQISKELDLLMTKSPYKLL
tara:strand:- start:471 stop:1661 length:1191 start_codon:yes stop_codon:yes gene_type:complete